MQRPNSPAVMLTSVGRTCYAIAIVAFGVLHFVHADFVTRVIPWWPAWIPGRAMWAYAVGAILIAIGTVILVNWRTTVVASALGAGLLLSFLLVGAPLAATGPLLGSYWTWAGKALALSGGAFLVARTSLLASTAQGSAAVADRWLGRVWLLAPWFFAAFLVQSSIQHFLHVEFVKSLVPTWIPGALMWTHFTGLALIAGGVGLIVPQTARLAALLTGGMIFTWLIVLHIPRAVSALPRITNETTAVFEALAMSGIAWLVFVNARLEEPAGRKLHDAAAPGRIGDPAKVA